MNLKDILETYPDLIQFDFPGTDKESVITEIISLLNNSGLLTDKERFTKDVFARENEYSTGIGMGIAIPHAKSLGVKTVCFTIIKLENEVEWISMDGKPVKLVIMLVFPDQKPSGFLKLLSTLSYNLMDDDFREGLLKAKSREEVIALFEDVKQINRN